MSIRSRLLATYLLLTALGIGLVGFYHLSAFRSYFLASTEEDISSRTIALVEGAGEALELGNLVRLRMLVQRNALRDGITVRVIGPDGRLIASSDEPNDRQVDDWRQVPGVSEALASRPSSGVARGVLARGDRYYQTWPIRRQGRLLGVLRMSLTLEHFQSQLRRNTQATFFAMGVSLVLCAVVSVVLARGFASPIQAMRDFAVRIGNGQFSGDLGATRRDELGELANELSAMGARLAALEEERRRFLASVSHELRTPVSNIQVTLEALANGAAEEPELRERFTHSALDEIERMRILIQDLLELGRLEAGAVGLEVQAISLSRVAARAVRLLEPRIQKAGIQVVLEVPDLLVQVDVERITQVLVNLLDNALKFAPRGSTVTVSGEAEGHAACLFVADSGPGIRAEDVPHVFEPFYVADPSRRGSGTGLGLAIARGIAEAHGGTLTVETAPTRGATFALRLPSRSRATAGA